MFLLNDTSKFEQLNNITDLYLTNLKDQETEKFNEW